MAVDRLENRDPANRKHGDHGSAVDPAHRFSLDLAPRSDELTRLGFTIVSDDESGMTATRVAPAGRLPGIRWTTIIRLRRVAHLDERMLLDDRAALCQAVPALDPPDAPWHSRTGRALLVCYLADTVDDGARSKATLPPARCLTGHPQAAILEGNGTRTEGFGVGLYMPQVTWIMRRVLDPAAPDPGEPKTVLSSLGWLMRGNVVLLVLSLVMPAIVLVALGLAAAVLLLLLLGGMGAVGFLAS